MNSSCRALANSRSPGTVYSYIQILGMKPDVLESSLHLGTQRLVVGSKLLSLVPCELVPSRSSQDREAHHSGSIPVRRGPAAHVTICAYPKRSRAGCFWVELNHRLRAKIGIAALPAYQMQFSRSLAPKTLVRMLPKCIHSDPPALPHANCGPSKLLSCWVIDEARDCRGFGDLRTMMVEVASGMAQAPLRT
jgi:hypothetical protein